MMEDLSRDFMQEGAKNERERILKLIDEMDNEDNWEFKCPVCGDDVLEELKKRITGGVK